MYGDTRLCGGKWIRVKMSIKKKKIVYLFGTGATQAEISLIDDNIRILMRDIREGILGKIKKRKIKALEDVVNELSDENTDVEHLITLYESTGSYQHNVIARTLKAHFRQEIQQRIGKLFLSSPPKLFSALIDMHEMPDLDEEIKGIFTLNYEDIAERAIQHVRGGIDYAIKVTNKHKLFKFDKSVFPILKLHGSFNWKNEFPISVNDTTVKEDENVLWIAPGVEKRRDKYPFSLIWGKAKELLDCDILRVIGCSLSRNDWELISLIYTTQKLNIHKKEYIIELIDYFDAGEEIKTNYPYLRFRTILEIKEFSEFIVSSYCTDHKRKKPLSKAIENYVSRENTKMNIFDTWLRARGEDFKKRRVNISTSKKIFENYINEV
jgi:hypothetical protein